MTAAHNPLAIPVFTQKASSCNCKPGCCTQKHAEDCTDWVKSGMKRPASSPRAPVRSPNIALKGT